MPDLTGAALGLAAEGFFVFPCRPNAKPPALEGWQDASTRDPDTIRALWAAYGNDCNIGINCGRSGLAVIDIDDKYGKLGSATWAALQLVHGDAPPTRMHRTPSGGRHLLYRQDGTIGNHPIDRSCIDMRGVGGYVLGPGSIIDGITYAGETGTPVSDFPGWAKEVINARRHEVREGPDDFEPDTEWAIDQARQEIARWVAKGWVPQLGSRNNCVASIAARLKGLGLSEEKSVELIDDLLIPHGEAPDEDTAYIVHSAHRSAVNAAGSELRPSGSQVHGNLDAVLRAGAEQLADGLWYPRDLVRMPRITYWDRDCLLPKMRNGAMGIWFGPTGHHKTGVIIAKIIELYQHTTANVLYLCSEGREGFGPRLGAQLQARGIDAEGDINDRLASQYVPTMSDESDVQRMVDRLDRAQFKPDIIFMDTMTSALMGFDEDSRAAAQMTRNGVVGKFAARMQALVILVGHTSASTNNRQRGAQGYQDNVDVMIGHQADRKDNARGVILSTYGDDGGKQKEGRATRVYYALDHFHGMVVPRQSSKREYDRLVEKGKYDFDYDQIAAALIGCNGIESGMPSKVVVMKLWPNDNNENPEEIDAFWNRQAARLERQAARHVGLNNSRTGGALVWFLP